jgi:hypothetical protein
MLLTAAAAAMAPPMAPHPQHEQLQMMHMSALLALDRQRRQHELALQRAPSRRAADGPPW